ncbi:accessory gland-specific peptide 26Ab [Drosophila suzukii]|uniref:Accessory gland-specific peptide 26Ab n=1 Tax=Drosophila suzukii TaxID=28584 RepID=A0AB39Z3H6_DROSZ|nr:accessory gland-specific peptide 26Ab [Drosophila suzukii]
MNYIALLCIFTYICLWQFTEAAPYISIESSSRSKSEKMVGGLMRTLYDLNVQDKVDDFTGQLVHRRQADFKSDFMSPEALNQLHRNLGIHINI